MSDGLLDPNADDRLAASVTLVTALKAAADGPIGEAAADVALLGGGPWGKCWAGEEVEIMGAFYRVTVIRNL